VVGAILLSSMLCSPAALFARKEKGKDAPAAYALIAGTVYRPPGFAIAGAEVVVTPEQPQAGGVKLKKMEAVSDARGEWAVRVPPVLANWRVDVKRNGYRPDQRSASVEGEQRVDLSIVLEPVSQSGEGKQ
jgi:Carboxypeptidase regulatory-like domain